MKVVAFPAWILFGISLIGLMLCLALAAGAHFFSLVVLLPLTGFMLFLGWSAPTRGLAIYCGVLPVLGFLNMKLALPGIPVLLALLWALIVGYAAMLHHRRSVIHIDRLPALYLFWLALSAFIGVVRLPGDWSGLHSVVSTPPWGDPVILKNAIGWIVLHLLLFSAGVMMFFAFRNRQISSEALFKCIFIGCAFAALIAGAQYWGNFMWAGFENYFNRSYLQANGTFSTPSAAGLVGAMMFPLWLSTFFSSQRRAWVIGVGPLLLLLVYASGARSGYLILIVSVAVFAMRLIRTGHKKFLVLLVATMIAMAGLICYQIKYRPETRLSKFWGFLVASPTAKDLVIISFGDRLELWKAGWVVARENPILGTGIGTYLIRMPEYRDQIGPIVNDNSCSMYLHLWAEQGLLGLLFFLGLIAMAFRRMFRDGLSAISWDVWGVFSSMCGLLVAFIFGVHLLNFEVQILFWILLAVLWTYKRPSLKS